MQTDSLVLLGGDAACLPFEPAVHVVSCERLGAGQYLPDLIEYLDDQLTARGVDVDLQVATRNAEGAGQEGAGLLAAIEGDESIAAQDCQADGPLVTEA